jgi:hypothetical protein
VHSGAFWCGVAGHGDKLTRKQEQAIAALLTEPTLACAAARADVSLRALKAWTQLPAFDAAYRAARRAVLERTINGVVRATARALATLERALGCGTPGVEVRAAVAILDQAREGLVLFDLAAEVEALKAWRAEVEGHPKAEGGP